MENSYRTFKNPIRFLLSLSIFSFFLFLIVHIGISVFLTYEPDVERRLAMQNINTEMVMIGSGVFNFISPFLQLIIILLILEWLINKLGISSTRNFLNIEWNTQTVIAIIIIVAFSLATLSGIQGAAMLKDLALVVVGFYFGTQKKSIEMTKNDEKIITTEEHTNERNSEIK